MRIVVLSTFILLCFTACLETRPQKQDLDRPVEETRPVADSVYKVSLGLEKQSFINKYEGFINDQYAIQMKLINWGDGTLTGAYSYNSVGKSIALNGSIKDKGLFQLDEYVEDKKTGFFKGVLVSRDKVKGFWYKDKTAEPLEFSVKEVKDSISAIGWSGNWYLNDVWDGGQLIIGNVNEETFDFALSVVRSMHIAQIDGTATIDGNKAYFNQTDITDEPCDLTFEKFKGNIELSQNSSTAACGFGMRAYVGATYEPKQKNIVPLLTYGNEGEIFQNQKIHDEFRVRVGRYYETFAFNMQQVQKMEKHPKDDFSATITTGTVLGTALSNEAIILHNRRGNYWAATIDMEDVEDEPVVRYFTNVDNYKKRLPYTIEVWRKDFKNLPVIFMDKK